jgi:hypothetical protein
VATKLAIEAKRGPVDVVRIWVKEEHSDNDRFTRDCEEWFGQPITIIKDEKYGGSVNTTILTRKYVNGAQGAPCSMALKKWVRQAYQRPDDVQVFGYSYEEQERLDAFIDANNDARVWAPLIEAKLTHRDCLGLVDRAGIELPEMYKLGFTHNNCVGCVKGQSGYWNKIRVHFPERFAEMAKIERQVGATCIRIGKELVYLDTLDPSRGRYQSEPEIQCGIACELQDMKWNNLDTGHLE